MARAESRDRQPVFSDFDGPRAVVTPPPDDSGASVICLRRVTHSSSRVEIVRICAKFHAPERISATKGGTRNVGFTKLDWLSSSIWLLSNVNANRPSSPPEKFFANDGSRFRRRAGHFSSSATLASSSSPRTWRTATPPSEPGIPLSASPPARQRPVESWELRR